MNKIKLSQYKNDSKILRDPKLHKQFDEVTRASIQVPEENDMTDEQMTKAIKLQLHLEKTNPEYAKARAEGDIETMVKIMEAQGSKRI